LGDSNTIVLAAARPTEQLPMIGWRVPSAEAFPLVLFARSVRP